MFCGVYAREARTIGAGWIGTGENRRAVVAAGAAGGGAAHGVAGGLRFGGCRAHARFSFEDGVLRVEVPGRGWRAELQALAPRYLAVHQPVHTTTVHRIEFVVAHAGNSGRGTLTVELIP